MSTPHVCDVGAYDPLCPDCYSGRAWQIAEAYEALVASAAGCAGIDAAMLGNATLDDYCDSGALLAEAFASVVGRPMWTPADVDAGTVDAGTEGEDWDLCALAEGRAYDLLREGARRRAGAWD